VEKVKERSRIRKIWNAELGGIDDDTTVIGIVARLSEEKRHQYLLETLGEIHRKRPDLRWRLLAIGSGVLEASLKQVSAKLGLAKNVSWLGYKNDAAAWMPGFDLLAFTSSAEGLPIAALEAGWAGIPLFTSNVGALPELVEPSCGIVFPSQQEPSLTAKSLASLLDQRSERERMGICLQNRVASEYSAEAWVRRMETIYQSI
jgi:glycosyltransferase involved in cell wall biosynthesis